MINRILVVGGGTAGFMCTSCIAGQQNVRVMVRQIVPHLLNNLSIGVGDHLGADNFTKEREPVIGCHGYEIGAGP